MQWPEITIYGYMLAFLFLENTLTIKNIILPIKKIKKVILPKLNK
jgi:hypothetical protein